MVVISIACLSISCGPSLEDAEIATKLDVAYYAVKGIYQTVREVKENLETGSIDRESALKELGRLNTASTFLLQRLDLYDREIKSVNIQCMLDNIVDAKDEIILSLAGVIELSLLDQPREFLCLPGIEWKLDDNGDIHFTDEEGNDMSFQEVYDYLLVRIDQHLDEVKKHFIWFWQEDHNS